MGILSAEALRERNLKALGKSLDWYDAKFREQNGACAVCHRPQTRMGLDGKPRPLVANVAGDCLLCQRCANRSNKQNQRERDTNYKALKAKRASGPQNLKAFWTKNRNGLTEEEKVAHETRDGEIINFICSIQAWVAEGDLQPSDDEGRECFRECAREIFEEIQQHRTVETGYIDWQDETKRFQSAADGLYHHFGYFAAIPDDVASRFIEFSERALGISVDPYGAYGGYGYRGKRIARILATLDGETYVDPDLIVKCCTPGCPANITRALGEIPPAQWFCGDCTAARQRAAQAVLSAFRNAQLNELRNVNQPRRQWVKSFVEREANDHDTVYGEEGPYGG